MLRLLAVLFLKVLGFEYVGPKHEDVERMVIIAAPHTSNWDGAIMLALAAAHGFEIRWMGKESLFEPPFGFVLKWLGGVAVDRSKNHDLVGAMADRLRQPGRFWLAVPASGTRSKKEYWKSGFYFIARQAGVPVALGYIDYGTRTASLGKLLHPSGDISADMDIVRDWYADKVGKHPHKKSRIRLRQEDARPDEQPAAEARDTDDRAPADA